MIYLDNAATTLRKPPAVKKAVEYALERCANPGRGGYPAAAAAAEAVYRTRDSAAELFDCLPEQVCFTANATEALNAAIRSLAGPGDRVVISCLEHNAVTRTLAGIGAVPDPVRPRDIYSKERWLEAFETALTKPASAVVCMQVSNVFGCELPIAEIAALCEKKGVPLAVDASQSAGVLPVRLRKWNAAFIAMPGHKALFGPQGTGMLLCGRTPSVLRYGGTGSASAPQQMPEDLPDRMEAGTLNVPGICGLGTGIDFVRKIGTERIAKHERRLAALASEGLRSMGFRVFSGRSQLGVVSFLAQEDDPELVAAWLAERGAALRAGLHCAPLAHQSMGTFPLGTVRLSVSALTTEKEIADFLALLRRYPRSEK